MGILKSKILFFLILFLPVIVSGDNNIRFSVSINGLTADMSDFNVVLKNETEFIRSVSTTTLVYFYNNIQNGSAFGLHINYDRNKLSFFLSFFDCYYNNGLVEGWRQKETGNNEYYTTKLTIQNHFSPVLIGFEYPVIVRKVKLLCCLGAGKCFYSNRIQRTSDDPLYNWYKEDTEKSGVTDILKMDISMAVKADENLTFKFNLGRRWAGNGLYNYGGWEIGLGIQFMNLNIFKK